MFFIIFIFLVEVGQGWAGWGIGSEGSCKMDERKNWELGI